MGDVADLIKDIQQNAGGNGPGAVAVALDAFEGAISTVANLAGAFTGLPLVISVVNQNSVAKMLMKRSKLSLSYCTSSRTCSTSLKRMSH